MGESKLTLTLLDPHEKISVRDTCNLVKTDYGFYLLETEGKHIKGAVRNAMEGLINNLTKFGDCAIPTKIEVSYECQVI